MIPEEIEKKIGEKAEERYLNMPGKHWVRTLTNKQRETFTAGATFGYSLAVEHLRVECGWIDVREELPKSNDGENEVYCLVNDTYWGIIVRPFNIEHHCWDGEDADDYYTDAVGGKITHWQPLPTPPNNLK